MSSGSAREFIERFERKHGTVNCSKQLSGCVLLTEEGQKRFREEKLIEKRYEYTRTSCELVDELLKDAEIT